MFNFQNFIVSILYSFLLTQLVNCSSRIRLGEFAKKQGDQTYSNKAYLSGFSFHKDGNARRRDYDDWRQIKSDNPKYPVEPIKRPRF